MTVYIVTWCGLPCAGNPHKTHEAARKWIDEMYASAKAAKQPMYGNYAIKEKSVKEG